MRILCAPLRAPHVRLTYTACVPRAYIVCSLHTSRVHLACFSCAPCAHFACTSCTPHVRLVCQRAPPPCVHLIHLMCTLRAPFACAPRAHPVHLVCALRAPCAHLVYALCAPRAHLCTPRVPVGALRAHLLCISCAPCMKLACTPRRAPSVPACATPCVHRGHLEGILWAPFVHRVCTPCASR